MTGRQIYQTEIRHRELNKYRLIRGTVPWVVQQKAELQQAAWAEMWAKKEAAQQRASAKEELKQLAEARTCEAQEALQEIETLLKATLDVRPAVEWEKLKDTGEFKLHLPEKPQAIGIPGEPSKDDLKYRPKLGIFDRLSSARRQRKLDAAAELFRRGHDAWLRLRKEREENYKSALEAHEESVVKWRKAKE